ncbi:MAG: aminopeptidase [Aquificae bacterium]|nr:aminopeptidase [Aquificota bacterium]
MSRDKLLVHVCCAPDALYFLKRFRQDHPEAELYAYFYDPNIHPPEEYLLRLKETERVCKELSIKLVEGPYEPERWLTAVKGLEGEPEGGARCSVCFTERLESSARLARKLGATAFTTTLLMSPRKNRNALIEAGRTAARRHGLTFLSPDYRKGGGTQELYRLSNEYGLYRQSYCGCIYGLISSKPKDAERLLSLTSPRPPGSPAEKLLIKELRLFAQELGLPVYEESFPFLNWRLKRALLECDGEPVPSEVLPYSPSLRGQVKADFVRQNGPFLYFNKQHLRVLLSDRPVRPSLSPVTYPTFVVPASYEQKLKTRRVKALLETELFHDETSVLVIGEAKDAYGVPADAPRLTAEKLKRLVREHEGKIKRGELSVALLGAQSLGAGERFAREELRLNLIMVLEY